MIIKDHHSPGSESESRAHEVQVQSTSTLTHQGKSGGTARKPWPAKAAWNSK